MTFVHSTKCQIWYVDKTVSSMIFYSPCIVWLDIIAVVTDYGKSINFKQWCDIFLFSANWKIIDHDPS